MSDPNQAGPAGARPENEEELRRAVEAQLERVPVDEVLLQALFTVVEVTARRAGLVPPPAGTQRGEPDLEQVRQGIEAIRALLALLEPRHAAHLDAIREALSQLQMTYARAAGAAAPPSGAGGAPPPEPGRRPPEQPGSGPAQRSGRLWVPGQ